MSIYSIVLQDIHKQVPNTYLENKIIGCLLWDLPGLLLVLGGFYYSAMGMHRNQIYRVFLYSMPHLHFYMYNVVNPLSNYDEICSGHSLPIKHIRNCVYWMKAPTRLSVCQTSICTCAYCRCAAGYGDSVFHVSHRHAGLFKNCIFMVIPISYKSNQALIVELALSEII